MFHFPASTPTQTMHSSAGNTTQPVLGFPIRTSSDQRFVDNSPRLNAASHVLHRLSMPRHPPYALNNQKITQHDTTHTTHQKQQTMRADTQNTYKTVSQTTKTCKTQKSTHTPQTMEHGKKKDARVHYTVLTQHTHTTTTTQHNAHDHSRAGQQDNHNHTHVQLLCAAPDTQQHANAPKTLFAEKRLRPRSATQALHVLRVCIHPEIFNTFFSGSHTHGDINHQHTHNRGHNTKSSLERR